MALAFVQRVDASNNTGTTIAPDIAAPTQNNLLVANVFTKSDGGITNPTGFTTAKSVLNGTNLDTLRQAYKIAGASEADPQWTGKDTDAETAAATYEYSGNDTSSPFDAQASTAFTTGQTSLSSGTTATLAQAAEVCVAAFGLRGVPGTPALNNSYTLRTNKADPSNAATLLDGDRIVAATTAQSTTASWTTSLDVMSLIGTYKEAGGAATTRGSPFGNEGNAFAGGRTFLGILRRDAWVVVGSVREHGGPGCVPPVLVRALGLIVFVHPSQLGEECLPLMFRTEAAAARFAAALPMRTELRLIQPAPQRIVAARNLPKAA